MNAAICIHLKAETLNGEEAEHVQARGREHNEPVIEESRPNDTNSQNIETYLGLFDRFLQTVADPEISPIVHNIDFLELLRDIAVHEYF